jgi:hypothetical protein
MELVEQYLEEIQIVSGTVPFQIFRLGSKEVWLFNFRVGHFIRSKLFKRAMHLTVDSPKELRYPNGASSAEVRQYDLHIRHIEKSRIVDEGKANIKLRMNPLKIGWFSTGTVFDLHNFQGLKSLKENDIFRLRIQRSKQDQVGGGVQEPTLHGEIMRIEKSKL